MELQRRNKAIESSKDTLISRAQREANNNAVALERALKGISERDNQIHKLMERGTDRTTLRMGGPSNSGDNDNKRNRNRTKEDHDYSKTKAMPGESYCRIHDLRDPPMTSQKGNNDQTGKI